jgi:hypothetical protein
MLTGGGGERPAGSQPSDMTCTARPAGREQGSGAAAGLCFHVGVTWFRRFGRSPPDRSTIQYRRHWDLLMICLHFGPAVWVGGSARFSRCRSPGRCSILPFSLQCHQLPRVGKVAERCHLDGRDDWGRKSSCVEHTPERVERVRLRSLQRRRLVLRGLSR